MNKLKLKNKDVINSKGNNILDNDSLAIKLNKINSRNITTQLSYANSAENINEGYCVSNDDQNVYVASSSLKNTECVGICFKSCAKKQKICYVTSGVITNNSYIFTPPFGRPVWVSISGLPTDFPPGGSGYLQIIGYTLDENSFFLDISPKMSRSTSDIKNKTNIPIINQLFHTTSDEQIAQGTPILSSTEVKNSSISIAVYTQKEQSSLWKIKNFNNIANIQVLAINEGTSTYTKILPNNIYTSGDEIHILLDQEYSGIVTYCILN